MSVERTIDQIKITWTSNKSQPISIGSYRNAVVTAVGTGDISVLCSGSETEIDFTAPSTIDNAYSGVVLADLGVPNTYATSLSLTAETKLAELNSNLIGWICLVRSVNTLDAYVSIGDNQ